MRLGLSRSLARWCAFLVLLFPTLVQGEERQFYRDRPDILRAETKVKPDAQHEAIVRGHLEAALLMLHLYPNRDFYLLGRDGEYLYDTMRLLAADNPKLRDRIHLINVSRGNQNDRGLESYLKDAKFFSSSEKVVIDTGFNGSIVNLLNQLHLKKTGSQVEGELMVSVNPRFATSLAFALGFNPRAHRTDPTVLPGELINKVEDGLPHFTSQATGFEKNGDKTDAVSVARERNGLEASRAERMQSYFRHYLDSEAAKELVAKRAPFLAEVNALIELGDPDLLAARLRKFLSEHPRDAHAEAVVRDVVSRLPQISENRANAKPTGSIVVAAEHNGTTVPVPFSAEELAQVRELKEKHPTGSGEAHAAAVKALPPALQQKLRVVAASKQPVKRPVVIMLDIDETVLTEVPVEHAGKKNVQSFSFTAQGLPKANVTTVVRPGIEQMLAELAPRIASGEVRVLITSANYPERTAALYDAVKVGGKSLRAWGTELVDKLNFTTGLNDDRKDMERLRAKLQIPEGTAIIAIDDRAAGEFAGVRAEDRVFQVPKWDTAAAVKYLEKPSEDIVRHETETLAKLSNLLEPALAFGVPNSKTRDTVRSTAKQVDKVLRTEPPVGEEAVQKWRREAELRPPVIPLESVGLLDFRASVRGTNLHSMRRAALELHPEWRDVLDHPSSELPKLVLAGNIKQLREMVRELPDPVLLRQIGAELKLAQDNPEVHALVEELLELRDPSLTERLAKDYLSDLSKLQDSTLEKFARLADGDALLSLRATWERSRQSEAMAKKSEIVVKTLKERLAREKRAYDRVELATTALGFVEKDAALEEALVEALHETTAALKADVHLESEMLEPRRARMRARLYRYLEDRANEPKILADLLTLLDHPPTFSEIFPERPFTHEIKSPAILENLVLKAGRGSDRAKYALTYADVSSIPLAAVTEPTKNALRTALQRRYSEGLWHLVRELKFYDPALKAALVRDRARLGPAKFYELYLNFDRAAALAELKDKPDVARRLADPEAKALGARSVATDEVRECGPRFRWLRPSLAFAAVTGAGAVAAGVSWKKPTPTPTPR